MGIVSEIKRLERADVAIGVGLFLATVAPGLLTIYLFKPVLMTELGTVPLLMFAAALGFPVLVLNFVCIAIGEVVAGADREGPGDSKRDVALPTAATFFVYYGALLTSYVERLTFRPFLWRLALFQGMIILVACAWGVGERRDRRKRKGDESSRRWS